MNGTFLPEVLLQLLANLLLLLQILGVEPSGATSAYRKRLVDIIPGCFATFCGVRPA
jgi:hypothetical protein